MFVERVHDAVKVKSSMDAGGVMPRMSISGSVVYFVDANTDDLSEAVGEVSESFREVIFIGIKPGKELLDAIKKLKRLSRKIIVRDNQWKFHGDDIEKEIIANIDKFQSLMFELGTSSSLASLMVCGEFADEDKIIISTMTPDGLLACLKAIGHYYCGMDLDSMIFSGVRDSKLSKEGVALEEALNVNFLGSRGVARIFSRFIEACEIGDLSMFTSLVN